MDYLVVFLILIALSLLSMFGTGARRFSKRARLISDYTVRKGYRLLNPSIQETVNSSGWQILTNPSLKSFVMGSEGINDIAAFARGTDEPFAFACSLASKEVTIFNFSVPTQEVDGKGGAIRYKVAKIGSEGLPRFSLGRRSVVHSVENVVRSLVGKPASTIDVDPRMPPDFANYYWLEGADRDAVFAFLSTAKLEFLANAHLKGVIAANPNYLVYREDGELGREDDVDSFIATVESVVANLL